MTAWQLSAACRGTAPMFDAWIDGESAQARESRHKAARRICYGECPVLEQCRAFRDPVHDFEVMAGHPAVKATT